MYTAHIRRGTDVASVDFEVGDDELEGMNENTREGYLYDEARAALEGAALFEIWFEPKAD